MPRQYLFPPRAASFAAFVVLAFSACVGEIGSPEELPVPVADESVSTEALRLMSRRGARSSEFARYMSRNRTRTRGPVARAPAPMGDSSAVEDASPVGSDTVAANSGRPGGLEISSALQLDKPQVHPNETLTASVTYTNTTHDAMSIRALTIAARAPGATHAGGPYTDLNPSRAQTTLPAGASISLRASRNFSSTDPLGRWEAYATYQDDNGVWHDGPSVFFQVSSLACVPETDAAFCERMSRACGRISGEDNCGDTRSVSSCGACDPGELCQAGECVDTSEPAPAPAPAAAPAPAPEPEPAPVTPTPTQSTNSGTMKIGTNFWYHTSNENNWSGETSMKSNVNWATAYGSGSNGLAVTNIWNDTFVAELAPYTTLRFMDWGNTNWSKITSWSQRMLPTDPGNAEVYIDGSSPADNPGMAYEWMIDLGNRTHKDIWLCLPARADAEYWTELAKLVKAKLQPDRKVYIEYSNETWNGGFGQFQDTIDQGVAQQLPGSNKYYQGQAYAVWQSLKIFKAFQDVFGASAMGSRVIRVFAYGGNLDTGREALRSVYKSSQWNPSGQKIDMLAIAPYVGSELDGSSSNIQRDFHAAITAHETREDDGSLGMIAFAVQDLKTFGIPALGAYEGGQHLLNNSQAWSSNPKIYDEYRYMLDRYSQYFKLFVHYAHTAKWTNAQNQSSWGALDHTGQPLSEAHKYRALVDWVRAHP